MLRDALGRATDLGQIVLGSMVLRPLFSWLRAARPDLVARFRHEPFAARGEAFVRSAGALGKAAFVAKMLGTDGGWSAPATSSRSAARTCDGPEMLFAGDLLYPGHADERSLSDALRARVARSACFVVNLEGTIGERAHDIAPLLTRRGIRQLFAYERDPQGAGWTSRFDVEALGALLGSAPRVLVSVANNHTLDDGAAGFAHTVERARALGWDVVGDARGGDGTTLVDVGSHRVGLFALSYGSNRLPLDRDCHLRFETVPYRLSRARIRGLAESLRERGATHVVALLHWGYEHEHEPAPEQRRCVELLFELGVSAVIGHHPHLLQPSEGAEGRWASYSLGDFAGGDRTIWSRLGAMVSLRFGEGGAAFGEVVPVAQSPFWKEHRTMLLEEAPRLERAVFARYFGGRL
jgi:hypothetical protein